MMIAYINGAFVPQSEARLPVNDAGFVWGATVTDLSRTVRHRLYRWPDHLARFAAGCRLARVPLRSPPEEITAAAAELVARNTKPLRPGQDLALVLLATPGPIGYYLGEPGGAGEPTLILHTFPIPFDRYRGLFERGARLVVPPTRAVPAACVDRRIKQRSRMHWWVADHEARAADPLASALLVDDGGHVTETAAANLLVVKNDRVLSPPAGSVLAGVSLRVVRELCDRLGVAFGEQPLTVADCAAADEAMLSNTAFCLAGVSCIDGVELPWPGPVFEKLLAAWGAEIGLDIRGQILGG